MRLPNEIARILIYLMNERQGYRYGLYYGYIKELEAE